MGAAGYTGTQREVKRGGRQGDGLDVIDAGLAIPLRPRHDHERWTGQTPGTPLAFMKAGYRVGTCGSTGHRRVAAACYPLGDDGRSSCRWPHPCRPASPRDAKPRARAGVRRGQEQPPPTEFNPTNLLTATRVQFEFVDWHRTRYTRARFMFHHQFAAAGRRDPAHPKGHLSEQSGDLIGGHRLSVFFASSGGVCERTDRARSCLLYSSHCQDAQFHPQAQLFCSSTYRDERKYHSMCRGARHSYAPQSIRRRKSDGPRPSVGLR